MTRVLGFLFFAAWMALAMAQNVPYVWDIMDIAAIICGIMACIILVADQP